MSERRREGSVQGALAAAREAFEEQRVPVRVYESDGRVMVAAPLPGLEPQDITVTVSGSRVTIHGHLRGPHQDERYLHAAEWQVGPYHREVSLPHPVDATRTNATYGNGVLVLACPKASPNEPPGEMAFTLTPLEATRGAHVGHAGREMHQASTEEHVLQMEETSRRAAANGGGGGREQAEHPEPAKARDAGAGPVNV